MIFVRSVPPRIYRDYTLYRPLLRQDFHYRCAYCLTHEYHLGSEANVAIDHHRPRNGAFARPDLEHSYANLYWSCRECNENKADNWPKPQQAVAGFKWLDPCESWGDHDTHWHISPEGEVQWLTPIGEYTVKKLMLHRREWLKRHWRQLYEWQQMRDDLLDMLDKKEIPAELAERLRTQLASLCEQIETPVIDRPRRRA